MSCTAPPAPPRRAPAPRSVGGCRRCREVPARRPAPSGPRIRRRHRSSLPPTAQPSPRRRLAGAAGERRARPPSTGGDLARRCEATMNAGHVGARPGVDAGDNPRSPPRVRRGPSVSPAGSAGRGQYRGVRPFVNHFFNLLRLQAASGRPPKAPDAPQAWGSGGRNGEHDLRGGQPTWLAFRIYKMV